MLHVMPCASSTRLVVLARVRAALVGVMQQARRRGSAASAPCRAPCSVRCRSLTALTAQPTMNRENRSRIAARYSLPLLADDELGRVADPPLIRPLGGELAVEQIGGDRLIVIAHRRALEPLARPRLAGPSSCIKPHDALATDALACSRRSSMNARAAVALRRSRRCDARTSTRSCRSRWRVRRLRPPLPRVEPAARDTRSTPTAAS